MWTYYCTDAEGNEATESVVVVDVVTSLTDTTPPVITLTGSNSTTITVNATYNDAGAKCEDIFNGIITMTPVSTVDTGTAGSYTVTYSCADASGNAAKPVSRTVIVQSGSDTMSPVIRITGDNPTVLTVGDTYTELGAVCDDDVDADKPATPSGTVNASQVGEYTITYSCTDASGNDATDVTRIVRVDATADTMSPVIRITGDNPTVLTVGDTYTEGAVCDDDVDADKPATPSGTVNASQVGEYTITYSCTDASGNDATEVSRTVTVLPDTTPPVITIQGANPARIVVNSTYTDFGAACTDAVDGPLVPTVTENTVNTNQTGSYVVTYSCTDAAINTAEKTRIVNVLEEGAFKRSSSSKSTPLTAGGDMTIDGRHYDISSRTATTITPYSVTTGQDVDITFTAYTAADIIHFTIYLNLHGTDTEYSNSDTYISYDNGEVEIHDPHGFISDASIIITEDEKRLNKKIIDVSVGFDGDMGLTNMVVYMWNDDRKSVFIRVIDALDVTLEPEPASPEPDPEPRTTPDPEPVEPDGTGGVQQTEELSDADILSVIVTWAGFEQGTVTDDELLRALSLDRHGGAHIPNWVMTELGALVSKGSITVDEFVTALAYVLENV